MDVENQYGALKRQKYYLPLIKDFHFYCLNNHIDYSLAYGSLLGAVRHKGFIPWDDDIDIMMTRINYDKFINCFEQDPMKGYVIVGSLWIKRLSLKTNPLIFSEGQCIDLFVLDDVPKTAIVEKIKIIMLKFVQGMLKDNIDYRRYSLFNRILLLVTHLCGSIFSKGYKKNLYNSISRWKGFFGESEFISISNAEFAYLGQKFSKNIASKYIDLAFEGMRLSAVNGYDEYLTTIYGDYMTPPPEKHRMPKHT